MKTHTKMIVHFIALRKSHYVILLFCAALILPATLTAQVAIGDSLKAAHPSAGLEVFSESKGFLPPRLTTAQRDSIASPADGLIVYDTDLNKLLYYHDNVWKDFGLWSRRDSTSGNLYYNGGRVAIGIGSDTIHTLPASLVVTGFGSTGIMSYAEPDTAQLANAFIAEMDNTYGDNGNFFIQTFSTGGSDNVSHGMYSFIESDSRSTYASTSQAYYNGTGGSLSNLEDIPFVVASGGDVYIEDTSAEVVAVATRNIAESDHSGINLGSYASALSEGTRANIGSVAVVNTDDQFEMLDTMLLGVFPGRFTIGQFVYNAAADTNDYGLYSAGDAQNYFGGSVGIGTLAPTKKLDVAGAVNATAYYLNGDSLTFSGDGVWEQNGENISYANGTVSIGLSGGLPVDTVSLAVMGNVAMITDTQKFPLAFFSMGDSTGFLPDSDSDNDHSGIAFGIANSLAEDTSNSYLGFRISYDHEDSSFNSHWAYVDSAKLHMITVNEDFEGNEGIIMFSIDGGGEPDHGDWNRGSRMIISPTVSGLSHGVVDSFGQVLMMNDSMLLLGAYGSTPEFDSLDLLPTFIGMKADTTTLWLGVYESEQGKIEITDAGVSTGKLSVDEELSVNGNIKQSITTSNVSNPPTDTELDTLFTSPASKGDGWTAYVKDSNTDNLYQIMVVGTDWYIIGTTKAQ